jgi:hypothetical protein
MYKLTVTLMLKAETDQLIKLRALEMERMTLHKPEDLLIGGGLIRNGHSRYFRRLVCFGAYYRLDRTTIYVLYIQIYA